MSDKILFSPKEGTSSDPAKKGNIPPEMHNFIKDVIFTIQRKK